MARLRKELVKVLPNPRGVVDFKVLENLPYLVSATNGLSFYF